MDVFINKTNRAIVIGGNLLVPGVRCRIEHANKLKSLYPRFAEMLDKGDIAPYTKDAGAQKNEERSEVESEVATGDDEPKPIPRRKRV